jgi:hypothetical protein
MSTKTIVVDTFGRELLLSKMRLSEPDYPSGFYLKLIDLSVSRTTVCIYERRQDSRPRLKIIVPFSRIRRVIGCRKFDSKNFRIIMSAVRGTKKALAAKAGAR